MCHDLLIVFCQYPFINNPGLQAADGRKSQCTHSDNMYRRDRPRFFDQVGHQTTNASIENEHFFTKYDVVRLTKIMNNLVKDLKILSFKVIFQCLRLVESF